MSPVFLSYYFSDEAKKSGAILGIPRIGDAGFDLSCIETINLSPGEKTLIKTGLYLAIPKGWVGLLKDRSSVGSRGGITAAGVIDSSYRGEVKILMYNIGMEHLKFSSGDRVAQLVIIPHLEGGAVVQVHNLAELGETARNQGGFGSTGA